MKIGFSSYCFRPRMMAGDMSIGEVIRWIGKTGGSHMELASLSLTPPGEDNAWNLHEHADLLAEIEMATKETGVALSGICIPANFLGDSADQQSQIARTKQYVDLCDRLGVRFLRHDVTNWSRKAKDIAEFEACLPQITDASAEIADYAARFGVTTSIENHGFFFNASERVQRLIHEVGRPNFKTTIDVGNFLCVDEDPLIATERNLPVASFVHLKDFYVRKRGNNPGDGWLKTLGGNYLLGSIVGFGDMDTRGILGAIVESGYDGFVSIEFEGNEDCLFACATGFKNITRILAEIGAA